MNLRNCHVPIDGLCPICRKHSETIDHALFRCSRAKRFWRQLNSRVKIREYNYQSIQDRFLDLFESDQEDMLDWIFVGAWAIWNDRNNTMHGKVTPSVNDKCDWVHNYIQEFQQANCTL